MHYFTQGNAHETPAMHLTIRAQNVARSSAFFPHQFSLCNMGHQVMRALHTSATTTTKSYQKQAEHPLPYRHHCWPARRDPDGPLLSVSQLQEQEREVRPTLQSKEVDIIFDK